MKIMKKEVIGKGQSEKIKLNFMQKNLKGGKIC